MARVNHEFGPYWNEDSEILILGSFPSVKSRLDSFYYSHPQNRFWKVLSCCFEDELPLNIDQKKEFLKKHKIALWDVIESCDIIGSSDASIRNPICTDIPELIHKTRIKKIILNGKTAEKLFYRANHSVFLPVTGLPSTSPANANYSLEKLIDSWKIIKSIH